MQSENKQAIYLDPTALRDGVQRLGLGDYETLIERLKGTSALLVSDVYALQQVIYEHHLAGDTDYGYQISEALQSLLAEVYPITESKVLLARWLGEEYPDLLPRERLHVAVMRHHGVKTLVTGVPQRYRHLPALKLLGIRALL